VLKISPPPGFDPRTVHLESLYRLRYPGPHIAMIHIITIVIFEKRTAMFLKSLIVWDAAMLALLRR
jgi:hypothetical protein